MSFSDPIGDLITRIRNGQRIHRESVSTPASKERARVLEVLIREGYIKGFQEREVRKGIKEFDVQLKYVDGQGVITHISRVSKPGRRVYSSIADLPRVRAGLGISVLSTSRGVLSDNEARNQNVGGEVLFRVY